MKKYYYIMLLSLLAAPPLYPNENNLTTNHTHFRVRPQFQVGSPEQISSGRNVHRTHDKKNKINFSATLFGGKSTKRKDLGTFFMPFGTNNVTVNGQITNDGTDLLTQHFNLFSVEFSDLINAPALNGTPFKSIITLKPEQSVIGAGLSLTYDDLCIHDKYHWINVSAPLIRVKNRLGLTEKIVNQEAAFFPVDSLANTNLSQELKNMTDALNQDDWDYGKISPKSLDETKLAFIEVQIGERALETDRAHLSPYVGVSIPTGNKEDGEFIFEPIVGHAKHTGIFWGAMSGYALGESLCKNFMVHYETDTVLSYFFSRKQKRSLDLKYKPWSRYIEVYKNTAQAQQAFDLRMTNVLQSTFLASPGINELTLDLHVSPGFSFTSNHALLFDYEYCDTTITGEFGYNFYFHQSESVKLDTKFNSEAILKDHYGRGFANPVRNMTNDRFINQVGFRDMQANLNNFADLAKNYAASTITESDLDFNSATHPCTVSHTVYATLSGQWENCLCPIDFLFGGSYEFSGKENNALDRWLLWANVGISF